LKKANTGKEQKKDNNRLQDKINRQNIEKNKKLPGNINTKDNQNIEIIDGSIILKPNF
jgi:stalled ribosome alternative rescue factor ArfA